MKVDEGRENIWHGIDRTCGRIAHATSAAFVSPCAVVLPAWVLVYTIFIIGRTIFNVNWQFLEEFTQYWMMFIAFFSFPYALHKGVHIRISILIDQLPTRVRSILGVATEFLALLLICFFLPKMVDWFKFGLIHEVRSMTPLAVLLWPVYLVTVIGYVALIMMFLLRLYRKIFAVVQGGAIDS